MSRIGKQLIPVPQGVDVTINANTITVKGPKGELKYTFSPTLTVSMDEGKVKIRRLGDEASDRSLHGLARALINNMVIGVSTGFQKRLEIIGVGYRAQISGQKVTLSLGFSHPVEIEAPHGIKVEMDKEQKNTIVVSGIDKQAVGQFAANVRSYRKPEPYKGKGIRYVGEYVARKAGKAAGKDK